MVQTQTTNFTYLAAQFFLGSIPLALITLALFRLGIGLASTTLEKADRLFNALFTAKSGDIGMGLSICRSTMEAHGGPLSAFVNGGPGATFQFLPLLHRED